MFRVVWVGFLSAIAVDAASRASRALWDAAGAEFQKQMEMSQVASLQNKAVEVRIEVAKVKRVAHRESLAQANAESALESAKTATQEASAKYARTQEGLVVAERAQEEAERDARAKESATMELEAQATHEDARLTALRREVERVTNDLAAAKNAAPTPARALAAEKSLAMAKAAGETQRQILQRLTEELTSVERVRDEVARRLADLQKTVGAQEDAEVSAVHEEARRIQREVREREGARRRDEAGRLEEDARRLRQDVAALQDQVKISRNEQEMAQARIDAMNPPAAKAPAL